jgi:GT2 family glycosyltransferase
VPEAPLAALVDAVIVDYRAGRDLVACLESLEPTPKSVTVVDNAGDGTTTATLGTQWPGVVVVEPRVNVGFGAGINRGAARGSAPYVLVANPDIVLHEGAVELLVAALEANPRWCISAPTVLRPDGSRYPSIRRFPSPALAAAHALLSPVWERNPFSERYRSAQRRDEDYGVDWVSGACFLIRRAVFEQLGGFDEGYFMFAEDLDLCFRAHRLGFGIGFVDAAIVTHIEGVSRKHTPYRMLVAHHRSALRFQARSASGAARLLLPLAAAVLGVRLGVAILREGLARR